MSLPNLIPRSVLRFTAAGVTVDETAAAPSSQAFLAIDDAQLARPAEQAMIHAIIAVIDRQTHGLRRGGTRGLVGVVAALRRLGATRHGRNQQRSRPEHSCPHFRLDAAVPLPTVSRSNCSTNACSNSAGVNPIGPRPPW